jgi:hypothetical protein
VQRISDRLERMTIANDVAAYIGVAPGMVLDAFRKAAADRQEKTIQRPREILRPDERGLLNVLLSGLDGLEPLLDEIEGIEVLDRLATRRIFRAILANHANGAGLSFQSVNARLEEEDQKLLAEVLLSQDADGHEASAEHGRRCIESLQRSQEQDRTAELKARVKQAERAGNLAEALRLTEELLQLDRSRGARP